MSALHASGLQVHNAANGIIDLACFLPTEVDLEFVAADSPTSGMKATIAVASSHKNAATRIKGLTRNPRCMDSAVEPS